MKTLFDPTELAGMRLKNRLFRSATWLGLCEPDGTMRDEVFPIYEGLAEGGVAVDSCADICRILQESGLDFVEVLEIHTRAETGMRAPSRYRDLAVAVRRLCDIPIVLTGANVDVDVMEAILNEDGIEYFGLSRPLIREPGLPDRWRRGDRGRAECVGCNGCYRTFGKRCIFADREA